MDRRQATQRIGRIVTMGIVAWTLLGLDAIVLGIVLLAWWLGVTLWRQARPLFTR